MRRLVTIAAAVSLPLCLAILGLCLISTLHPMRWSQTQDFWGFRADHADYEIHHCVGLNNGVLYLQAVRRGRAVPGFSVTAVAGYPTVYAAAKTLLGFNLTWMKIPGWTFREVDFPLWPLALASAILPMRAYVRRRNAGRVGLCRNCNYDLTGNVSGVCPECGSAINRRDRDDNESRSPGMLTVPPGSNVSAPDRSLVEEINGKRKGRRILK